MAYNEISLPNWQQLVRRVFGLTGPGGNVPVIAPEIQPVVILQPDNAEFRRLRGENLWAFATLVTGGAAVRPSVGIVNPAGSGVMAIVERTAFSCRGLDSIQSEVSLRIDDQTQSELALPGLGTTCPRDTRITGVPLPGTSAVVGRQGPTGVNPGFFVGTWLMPALTPPAWLAIPERHEDIVLMPGFGCFYIYTAAGAGSALSASFLWYERRLETAELRA